MVKIVNGTSLVAPLAMACNIAYASGGGAMIIALSKLVLTLYATLGVIMCMFLLPVTLLG
jgi:hypothetical protein